MPQNDLSELVSKCQNPIERYFVEECYKHLSDGVKLESQVWVVTANAKYRLDFILTRESQRVGIECDGKDFRYSLQDLDRDEALIDEGNLHAIYRFRETDIICSLEICIWALCSEYPDFFSERGHEILATYFKNWESPLHIDVNASLVDCIIIHDDSVPPKVTIDITRMSVTHRLPPKKTK